ncbi:hypothetical protein EJB05_19200, partial [Eragrostis curvula]
MGKKSGSHGDEEGAKAFVLKVATHCHCDGCTDKIRAAVKDLVTRMEGIQSWDQSALDSKGELKLLATTDPEKLRHRLHKATRKNVDLVFPKPATDKNKDNNKAAATAAQTALLLNALQQQQQQHQGQYGNQLLAAAAAAGGYGGYGVPAAQAYPWAAQQPDPYAAYSAAYPAAGGAWGGYAYPPAAQQGYGAAWHGHGY